jgi:hypothetical protein
MPWDRRPSKNAVGTPCDRRDNATRSPRTSWQHSESVVKSQLERQGGRQRLHSVHAMFMAIPKRLHYDPMEFLQRLHSVHGDTKALALRPHGVFTAIAASHFYLTICHYNVTVFTTFLTLGMITKRTTGNKHSYAPSISLKFQIYSIYLNFYKMNM